MEELVKYKYWFIYHRDIIKTETISLDHAENFKLYKVDFTQNTMETFCYVRSGFLGARMDVVNQWRGGYISPGNRCQRLGLEWNEENWAHLYL